MVSDKKKELFDIGSAVISITPKPGIDLYTLDGKLRKSDNVHSELNANTVLIVYQRNLLVIVSLDLIWVDQVFSERIQKWVNLQYDLYCTNVLLVATHSHSTPQISYKICNSARPNPDYITFLYDQICQVIHNAWDNLEPCYSELSVSCLDLAVNRRKRILNLNFLRRGVFKTAVANRPNNYGACDDLLYSIWFYNSDGDEKAVLLNYSCHPTLFRNNAVSADYPGEVARYIKSHVSEDIDVCFLQGFAGNIKANFVQSSCSKSRGLLSYIYNCLFDRIQFNKNISENQLNDFSEKLARSSIERINARKINPELFFLSRQVKLPLQLSQSDHDVNLKISLISVGDNLRMLTLSGEIFAEYSLWLREWMNSEGVDLLTVGYCNDMVGYIPTQEAIKEGGYEVERTFSEFGLPSPFSDQIESVIKNKIVELIKMSSVE